MLRLPEGKTLRDLAYISVWCRKVSVNFGHLELKNTVKTVTVPTAIEIRPLSQLDHGVKSGPINIIDAQTFLITGNYNLLYNSYYIIVAQYIEINFLYIFFIILFFFLKLKKNYLDFHYDGQGK